MPERPLNGSRISPNVRGGHCTHDTITIYAGRNLHSIEVDDARGWETIMAVVCREMKIPAITSRQGLKKIHANFDDLYSRMKTTYLTCPESRRDDVRGGIAMVLSKMLLDSVLHRNLSEKGVLDLILPLFESKRTRQLAAVALYALAANADLKIRLAIFKKSNNIVGFIRDSLDDYKLTLFGIVTVGQCIRAVLKEYSESVRDMGLICQKLTETVDVLPLLEVTLESLTRHTTHPLFTTDHAIDLVYYVAKMASIEMHLPSLRFMVAGLRSKDWGTRGRSLEGLIWLHIKTSPKEQDILDPHFILHVFKHGVPPGFTQLYDTYKRGCDSEMVVGYKLLIEYSEAVTKKFPFAVEDLCVLGMKQAELILSSEYSVTDGKMTPANCNAGAQFCQDPKTKWLFESFNESLPVCAQALEERNLRGDQDLADILNIKYHLLNERDAEAVKIGKKALMRNPHHAYFYFAVAQSYNHYHGLYAAKKGLECPNLTPSLKWLMLERAVHHGGFSGSTMLQRSPPPGQREWRVAIALLTVAYEDAKKFVEGAPPDSRLMRNVGSWLVILTMLMEENLSKDFREFKTASEMIGVSEKFSEIMNYPGNYQKTYIYLAQKTVLEQFVPSQKEFSHIFEASDKLLPRVYVFTPNRSQLNNYLDAWFKCINLDEGLEQIFNKDHRGTGPPIDKRQIRIQLEDGKCDITMYRCSWCNNPSAVLRKCANCGNVQYCDKACQKAHWPKHKQLCKR